MHKFLIKLRRALEKKGLSETVATSVVGEYLLLTQPRSGRISNFILKVHAANVAHNIDVDEIWVGVDEEGDAWSDNMGGVRIDCTDLNVNAAIEKIVDRMLDFFGKVWFKNAV